MCISCVQSPLLWLSDAPFCLQVLDHVGQASKLLGKIEIPLQNLPSMDPVYVWLQVPRLDKKQGHESKV